MSVDAGHADTPPVFTLAGQVAVHYLDGSVVEGTFATQDTFNIFLTIDDEPVMIPRAQIKYVKGTQGQQIEPDASQATVAAGVPSPKIPIPEPDTQELVWDTEPVDDDEDDDDGTVVLFSEDTQADEDDDDEDDGTMVLFTEESGADDDEDDDDGTVVLYPNQAPPALIDDDDDDDGTLVLEPETPIPTAWGVDELDEDDVTVVIGDSDALPDFDDDDQTAVIGESDTITGTMLCVSGPHSGEVFKIASGITTIGRSSDNVIVLSNDKEISRHHAIIIQESGKFVIQDQNSLNGTFVNDEPVSGPRYLEEGDIVLVGLSTLRYQAE